jgi:magnesium transporter
MITNFVIDENGYLTKQEAYSQEAVIWCDVVNPSREERQLIESQNNLVLPQHNETMQIEYSNRFYEENNAFILSVNTLIKVVPYPESHVVTFVLTKNKVITLRYSNPNPINTLAGKLQRHKFKVTDHFDVLVLLLQNVVGAVANIFEMLGTSTDLLALSLMQTIDTTKRRDHGPILNKTFREISKYENVLSKGYQSLSSVTLLINYFERTRDPSLIDYTPRFESLARDVTGLIKHADYLTQKLEFQLESTLGLLNIEQTHIIKIFTVLAMVFMPPTLIASIYGMNFKFMPELGFKYGYFYALVLMLVSSLLPYRFFKRKGWI